MSSNHSKDLATIIGYACACALIGAVAGLTMAFLVSVVGSLGEGTDDWQYFLSDIGTAAMSFGSILGAIFGAQFGFRVTK
jgi:hypothetical protein